jgi:hypothetical protein
LPAPDHILVTSIDYVYQTAKPLAFATGLPVTVVDFSGPNMLSRIEGLFPCPQIVILSMGNYFVSAVDPSGDFAQSSTHQLYTSTHQHKSSTHQHINTTSTHINTIVIRTIINTSTQSLTQSSTYQHINTIVSTMSSQSSAHQHVNTSTQSSAHQRINTSSD